MTSKALEPNRQGSSKDYVNKVYVQFFMLAKATKSSRSEYPVDLYPLTIEMLCSVTSSDSKAQYDDND